jgi:glycine/D-amino acid oxidase-like deaminating enzyme
VTAPRHVVVCGAGVMGAAVAYFLSRRGVAVTVVERSGVACAASGKSGGFLALDWCDGSPLEPLARASFALHAELAKSLGTDYGYRRVDTFMLAARERGRVAGGHRITPPAWLDGDGAVTAALGSTATTAQLHPARFTQALVGAARALEPEIFPRPDGEVYVCGMADPAPLPDSPEAVSVNDDACAALARAAGRVCTALAAAPITRRQACYRPVTDDGLPLIGRLPGLGGAWVATGHGPWGMLNAPATGLALAEAIVDGAASVVDLGPFDPARLPAGR